MGSSREPIVTEASRRVNRLMGLTQGHRYLEIGVEKGETFKAVSAPSKVAVDPKFKFDSHSEPFSDPGNSYHETTSDHYFAQSSAAEQFDLIFLDGLHEYEQTYRDFTSSLARLSPGGIIVFDDTFPNDVFSSHRSHAILNSLRDAFGPSNTGWHGDVYKALAFVAVFHPDINYCSLAGRGVKSQTFLWRRDQAKTVTGRPSPELYQNQISNMHQLHYLWLLENFAMLNVVKDLDAALGFIEQTKEKFS